MPRWRPAGVRDALVVVLTVTTGAVDAASFLALGNVFSSVITGNMVLLGVSAGTGSGRLALHAGVALAGYSAGVLVGAPVAAQRAGRATWPASVTVTLAVELCILVAFSIGWELTGGHPRGGLQLILLVTLAISMGLQSAAVRQLGQMSTTYLTSTLTGVLAGLVTRGKIEARSRSLGVLAAIIVGAVAGAVAANTGPGWLPLAILIPLAVVIVTSVVRFKSVREGLAADG